MARGVGRQIVVPSGGGGGAPLTVEEVDGAPSVADVTTIQFDQADGFTVTDNGGGSVRIDVSAAPAPDINAQILAWVIGAA